MTSRTSAKTQPTPEHLAEAADWLFELRQEPPNSERVAEWLRWTRSDPAHLDAFEQVEALGGALQSMSAPSKALLLQRVLSDPARSDEQRRRRALSPRAAFWGIAAGVALLAVGALATWHPQAGGLTTNYTTARAENRAVELPDGSRMELGASSQLAVRFVGRTRSVELIDGEAFFKVKHDASRPFVVRVGTLQLTDVGTSFDVRRSGEQVAVTVAEGIVDVESAAPALPTSVPGVTSAPRVVRVRAGERISGDSFAASTESAKVKVAAPLEAASWRSGRLTYQDEPLSTVIADINRYARREIVIVDPDVGSLRFTGTVLEDRVDDWVDGAVDLFALRRTASADGKVLLYGKDSHEGNSRP